MPVPSAFEPRSYLEVPGHFGVHDDVVWHLATGLEQALQLSRSIDQHVQAIAVGHWLRRSAHSMSDLAVTVGERPETLSAKLRGSRPAPAEDLILWSWLTGTPRRLPSLRELCETEDDVLAILPRLGPSARSRRYQRREAAR